MFYSHSDNELYVDAFLQIVNDYFKYYFLINIYV